MAMQPWFEDAKLGIFVHWGIYAVDGVQESCTGARAASDRRIGP